MNKTLVTGSAGFIGNIFLKRWFNSGSSVLGLDISATPVGDLGGLCIRGDIRDIETVRKASEGVSRVLHLAAAHHDFGIDRDTYFGVNEQGAEVICQVMDERGIRDICFYSSVAVYGDAIGQLDELAVPKPNSNYGASKLAAEQVFRRWVDQGQGRRCLVIRPTVTFGANNWANMFSLIRQIDSGKFLRVGTEANIKSLAYVENIVEATLRLWERPGRQDFEVFNYVDKPDLTSGEIVAVIYERLGKRLPSFKVPFWVARGLALPFDAVIAATGKNLAVSSERLKKLFVANTQFEASKVHSALSNLDPNRPWQPIDLKEGIRRMVDWYVAAGRNGTPYRSVPPREIVT